MTWPKKKAQPQTKIWVATAEAVEVRGGGFKQLDVNQLAVNVNVFVEQMGGVLIEHAGEIGQVPICRV